MRYALLSDIHANLESLLQVLHALRNESIDSYFCLGDIVGYGANPNECIEEIRNICGVCVAGNHDRASIGLISEDVFNEYAREAVIWTRAALGADGARYLKSLDLVFEHDSFTMVHGTLDAPGEFEYMLSPKNAAGTFPFMRGPVCFVGHSHICGTFIQDEGGRISYTAMPVVPIKNGCKYIINVGSIGQPRDNNPKAAYGIFDTVKMRVEIKRVSYDFLAAGEKIIKAGLPGYLADRIVKGR